MIMQNAGLSEHHFDSWEGPWRAAESDSVRGDRRYAERDQIESLRELGFLARQENVTAAESGRRVYFCTLAGLVESLTEAKAAGQLARRMRVLTHPALMVVDEIGYLPVSRKGTVLFFQLINARHEQASTVLTSNKSFEEWGQVLGDEVMAAALIDRLLHHCHIVNIRGNSYRMRAHQNLWRSKESSQNHGDSPGRAEPGLLSDRGRQARSGARLWSLLSCRPAPEPHPNAGSGSRRGAAQSRRVECAIFDCH